MMSNARTPLPLSPTFWLCGALILAGCGASKLPAPTVVSATPAVGAEGIDPALTEIRVEFDQPMTAAPVTGPVPSVVRTHPAAGAANVDSSITELEVEFDQPMLDGSWSWVGGGESFPGVAGKDPRYKNATTVVLPVVLVPNHHYALSINSDRFNNFKSKDGVAATPFKLEFTTAPAAQ